MMIVVIIVVIFTMHSTLPPVVPSVDCHLHPKTKTALSSCCCCRMQHNTAEKPPLPPLSLFAAATLSRHLVQVLPVDYCCLPFAIFTTQCCQAVFSSIAAAFSWNAMFCISMITQYQAYSREMPIAAAPFSLPCSVLLFYNIAVLTGSTEIFWG